MDGSLCIDKPAGMTSFDVVSVVRRLTNERRAGHAGTLDPMATGVLPVFLGRCTRAIPLLPSHDKAYEARLRLGVTTATGDITGAVLCERPVRASAGEVREAALSFCGQRMQTPPMVSAVKVGGRRLYELAREGKTVERAARPVTFYAVEVTGADEAAGEYSLFCRCSAGAYIRVLCEEIGEALGCGAALAALRRTEAAGFSLGDCLTLDTARQLASLGALAQAVLPPDYPFRTLPAACVTQAQAVRFDNGGELALERVVPTLGAPLGDGPCRVLAEDGSFLGLAHVDTAVGTLTILLNRMFQPDANHST